MPSPGAGGRACLRTNEEGGERLAAAAVVLDAGTLEVVERAAVSGRTAFPYVPGLLAVRELPAVLDALEALRTPPDLVVCDGYGRAHPRRAGLAVHLGVLTRLPCSETTRRADRLCRDALAHATTG